MRFCSRHSTENVRLKKNIYVCGVVEDIVFVYRNVPDGSGIQTETKSLNVFEKQAVRDWGGGVQKSCSKEPIFDIARP